MNFYEYPSKLLQNAIDEFSKLPGVGKKTALRLVLHLLRQENKDVENFGTSIIKLKNEVKFCKSCNNISDNDICDICNNKNRDHSLICVVEDISDVMAIEQTNQFKGIYHVLGGVLSPMDGIGPNDLNFATLEEKCKNNEVSEIIFALSTTMEGDTTNFYLYKRLKNYNISFTTIARGVSVGDEIIYADEITLGRSIINRINYEELNVKY